MNAHVDVEPAGLVTGQSSSVDRAGKIDCPAVAQSRHDHTNTVAACGANYVAVAAATAGLARSLAAEQSGYSAAAIGQLVCQAGVGVKNSRQTIYVFATSHDVTTHPSYVPSMLIETFAISDAGIKDGPVLQFGPEVTVGG